MASRSTRPSNVQKKWITIINIAVDTVPFPKVLYYLILIYLFAHDFLSLNLQSTSFYLAYIYYARLRNTIYCKTEQNSSLKHIKLCKKFYCDYTSAILIYINIRC